MLQHLQVKNFALIQNLEIDFSEGFNVFTGETGAGKTIILNALNLVLGERASVDLLRPGADKLEVTALFVGDEREGLPEETILKREISSSGKSLAKINGEIVTLAELKQVGDSLVDLHGQHEHQSLLYPERHIEFLDAFAGKTPLLAEVKTKYTELQKAKAELARYKDQRKALEDQRDYLQFQLQEIRDINLQDGEDETLEQERTILRNTEALLQHAQESRTALEESESALRQAGLEKIAQIDGGADALVERYREILYSTEELGREVGDYLRNIDSNPARLLEVVERIDAINHLKRKYGSLSEILSKREQLEKDFQVLELGEEAVADFEIELAAKTKNFMEVAEELSNKRQESALLLEQNLLSHLQVLAMEKTQFKVNFERVAPCESGLDQVEFLISPNPGQPLRPLAKIASGGEISRVMLALKAGLLEADTVPTMIFDELDAGIGGKTAVAVGEKMKQISTLRQVLCITHLPQIASQANKHFVVEKNIAGQQTEVTVREVIGVMRQAEIARMLSGAVSETSLKHAEELLGAS